MQLGNGGGGSNGDMVNLASPVIVDSSGTPLSNVSIVSPGESHTCALSSGTLLCWGANGYGELGIGTISQGSAYPVSVSGLPGPVRAVSAGGNVTCAIVSTSQSNPVDGTVWCWGYAFEGQLGNGDNGTTSNIPTPVQALNLKKMTAISAGSWDTCSLNQHGIACWGYNKFGEVGTGNTSTTYQPNTVHFF